MSQTPADLRYTNDHEWVRVDGNKVVVGITHFAIEQLGDVTLVELPNIGRTLDAGAGFGTVESVKSVSDLFAPVSGTVTKINDELSDAPEKVNDDCYGDGWMVEIELRDPSELEGLMTAEAYDKHLADQ